VFLCFVRTLDGVLHFAKGMIAPLEVTEPAVDADVPAGDAALTLQDFAFVGLETLTAGRHTVTVTNAGPQPHEATIVKLADGIEAADLIPMFSSTEAPTGPPPFTSAGGVAGIANGQTGRWRSISSPARTHSCASCPIPHPALRTPPWAWSEP